MIKKCYPELDQIMRQVKKGQKFNWPKVLEYIQSLQLYTEKGEIPNPRRIPKEGKEGELWFRNRLLYLRNIPLEDKISFLITHPEASVYEYYSNHRIKRSADLIGLWRSEDTTKLCVAELKAGEKGDNILYAILEVARNAWLHSHAMYRLRKGWIKHVKEEKEILNAWRKSNPFSRLNDKIQLLIIGDEPWIRNQKKWKNEAKKLINAIDEILKFHTAVYALNRKAKPGSKPYALLPVKKWDKVHK